MNFELPEYTDLYSKLKDNNRLKKYLIKLGALFVPEDFYTEYGFKNDSIDKKAYIEEANNQIYKNIATLLLEHESEMGEKTIAALINENFLKEEIKDALGFESDIILPKQAYREIFYTYKYCYTESFFQNNWENFMPLFDFEQLDENSAGSAFMDAIMKEFDKLDYIISHSKDWISVYDIPYDYINYLTQLLGLEVKTFYMKDDTEGKYRELAANILDVYKGKGAIGTFKLLFNFLGFNLDIRFYYFDRRRYYDISGENLEFNIADNTVYTYYLTTENPADNYLEGLATNEIVNLSDFGENKNIFNFGDLVEKYGLRCVLGYDDMYEDEDGNYKTYTGDVYTYFKTNYIRVRPSKKFEEGNFSANQLYQLGALLDFLTPEFLQREIYVKVDIGGSGEEPMILNWDRYYNEVFCMLDSEEFRNDFMDLYLHNSAEYKLGYTATPTVIDDNGAEKNYYNSLGMNRHLGIDEEGIAADNYSNVFFNPLSEKIKIFNSTEHWGINKMSSSESGADGSGAVFPVWRTDRNYLIDNKRYSITGQKKVDTIYFPKDVRNAVFRSSPDAIKWNNTPIVSLNGYMGNTIKKKLATNSVITYSDYFDNEGNNINGRIRKPIKYVTELPITLFAADPETPNYIAGSGVEVNTYDQILKNYLSTNDNKVATNSTEEKLLEFRDKYKSDKDISEFKEYISDVISNEREQYNQKNLFEKSWREIENYTYYCCATYRNAKDLIKFIKECDGYIINFDYLDNKLVGRYFINLLSFGSDTNNDKVNNYLYIDAVGNTAANEAISRFNNYAIKNLINALTTENCYLIGYQTSSGVTTYYVYKYRFIKKFGDLKINEQRFVPVLSVNQNNYTVKTYYDIINDIKYDDNDNLTLYNRTTLKDINLAENYNYIVYVRSDGSYYRLSTVTLDGRNIIHKANVINPSFKKITIANTLENSENILGNIYFDNAYKYDTYSIDGDNNDEEGNNSEELVEYKGNDKQSKYEYLKYMRIPRYYQYKYKNIKKGDLIYSKYDGKLYECMGDSIYVADSVVLAEPSEKATSIYDDGVYSSESVTYSFSEHIDNKSSNIVFGLKTQQFYGEIRDEKIDNYTKYYLYNYDENYHGFSEADDDDNFTFNNYERTISWANLGVKFTDYTIRPIRENVDKYYDELNKEVLSTNNTMLREKNKLAFDILKEICQKSQDTISKDNLF